MREKIDTEIVREEKQKQSKSASKKSKREELKGEVNITEHMLSHEELFKQMVTDPETGLNKDEAQMRLERDGPNVLTPAKTTPLWRLFINQLIGGFQMLLWAAALLAFISYGINREIASENIYIGIVLVIVILLSALFTFYQDVSSRKEMSGFLDLVAHNAVVFRDGEKKEIPASTLVVGDVVEIKLGDKTPADIVIFENQGLKVDNSSMTGEAEPLERDVKMTDKNPLETKNLLFNASMIVEGKGKGIVIRTGDNTVIGRIAGLVALSGNSKTPLRREIDRFVKIIAVIAISCGIVFVIIAVATLEDHTGQGIIKLILYAIGIVIGAVPEGLLATVTVALRLTAKRMRTKNVLVKNLESVETLGSTSIICSDKTGTLTQNKMTVSHLWYNYKLYSTDPKALDLFDTENQCFKALHRGANLCNNTIFDPDDANTPFNDRKCLGDASETGLVRFNQAIRDIYEHRDANPRVCQIPFNSTTKWQISINRMEQDTDRFVMTIKGAPEVIWGLCTHIAELDKGHIVAHKITKEDKKAFDDAHDTLGGMGERVLGFAHLELDPAKFPTDFKFNSNKVNFPLNKFTFLGLISLIDPPREAVPDAIATCQKASIKVIMVTGDHPITAHAIAKKVGIIRGKTKAEVAQEKGCKIEDVKDGEATAIVVAGTQLKEMSDDELDEVLKYNEIVFARTSPQQKLIIVEGCQRTGATVPVTGDGVNDSPALKKADIGIAMGISGSDVSREAADIILMDDNFASIVRGVEEGRTIFDNLKKSIAYKLTANFPELIPFFLFVLFKLPLPLTTLFILAIDVGTDMWPAIALAYEPPEPDLMERGPRQKGDNLVNTKLIAWAYALIGTVQVLGALMCFLFILAEGNSGGNGFPPVSAFGLAQDFEKKQNQTDYNICRVQQLPDKRFIACANTTEALNELPESQYLIETYGYPNITSNLTYGLEVLSLEYLWDATNMTGNLTANVTHWANAILAGAWVDWCYNEEHFNDTLSCQLSQTSNREHLHRQAQTVYFTAIVQMQWACLIVAKSRKVSILTQGFTNMPLNMGWVVENLLAIFIIYVPFMHSFIGSENMRAEWFTMFVPWFIFIFIFDELRKRAIRKFGEEGFAYRHTYW